CPRGHTRPFDAIIIGERMIVVLDIWSQAGPSVNGLNLGFLARIRDRPDLADGVWQSFRRETEKLKALLQDRFEIEPGRGAPEKLWSSAPHFGSGEATATVDTADLRSFARAATRLDKASSFPLLRSGTVERIATFLTDEASAEPERTAPGP